MKNDEDAPIVLFGRPVKTVDKADVSLNPPDGAIVGFRFDENWERTLAGYRASIPPDEVALAERLGTQWLERELGQAFRAGVIDVPPPTDRDTTPPQA